MPNLDKFFEGCEIPPDVWRNAQEDSKIEPAEMAEYSAIEQTVCIWWLSNNKPLYWKIEHLQAGFENMNIGKLFKSMLEGHPQMYPSFHDIQLDLPETDQAAPSYDSHVPHNITVEYAEKQISKREWNFLQYLSTLVYKSEFVDKLAHTTSLDAAALIMTLKEQNGLPRSTLHIIFWLCSMQVYHTLKLKNCVSCRMYTMPWTIAKILKCLQQILNLSYPR